MTALVALLVVNALTMGSALLIVDRDFVARHGQLFAANRYDYDMLATTRLLRLAQSPPKDPLVVVVGNSITRAMFREVELESGLQAALARPISVQKLCTSKQSLLDMGGLLEQLPSDASGVVVVGLSPGMLTADLRRAQRDGGTSRYGFRSRMYDSVMQEMGIATSPRMGIYALDNAAFLSVRFPRLAISLLTGRRVQFVESGYYGAKPDSVAERAQGNLYSHLWREYAAHADDNLRILDRVRDLVAQRPGMQLLLMEAPTNPEFVNRFAPIAGIYAEHDRRMSAYARSSGLTYIRSAGAVPLTGDDFYDGIHLGKPATVSALTGWMSRQIAGQPALRFDAQDVGRATKGAV